MEIPFFWVLFFFLSYFSGVFRKACAGGLVWLAVNRILTFIMQQNWVNRVTFTTLIFKINISEIYLTAEYWMNMHERPELVCVWSARRCKCIFQASALCCLPTAWWPWRKVSAVPRELPRQRHRKLRQIFLFNIWVHCNIPSVLQIVCVFQRKAGPESQWIYSLWSLGPSLESPTRPLPLSRQSYLTLQRAVEPGSGLEQENYTYFLHLISQRKYFYQHKSGIVLADIGWCSVSSPWWSWCWTSWSTPCRTPSPAIWSSSAASWPGAWLQSSGMAATSSSTMWVSNCDAVKRLSDAYTSLAVGQFWKMCLLL